MAAKEENGKETKKKVKKVRTFWFACKLKDADGNELISPEVCAFVSREKATIKRSSWCIHDDDTVTKFDKETDENDYWGEVGTHKDDHLHFVAELTTPVPVSNIAKWFGLGEHMICYQRQDDEKTQIKRKPFEDMTAYWTHAYEDESKGKALYSREKVEFYGCDEDEVWASIDKRYTYKKFKTDHFMSADDVEILLNEMAHNDINLRKVREKIGIPNYIKYEKQLKKAREIYVQDNKPMPFRRDCFYVMADGTGDGTGKGGSGKTVCTHALAKQLAREFGADISKDYEVLKAEGYIYELGGSNVSFQSYDGEPVLVMNEMDAPTTKAACGGRRGVKELFEEYPTKQDIHKKYGSTICTARYVVVNGIDDFDTYVKGLSTKSKDDLDDDIDKSQYYRRFIALLRIVDEENIAFLFNRGILDGTKEYDQYYYLQRRANFGKYIRELEGVALATIEGKKLAPVLEETKKHSEKAKQKVSEVEALEGEYREILDEDDDYSLKTGRFYTEAEKQANFEALKKKYSYNKNY